MFSVNYKFIVDALVQQEYGNTSSNCTAVIESEHLYGLEILGILEIGSIYSMVVAGHKFWC
jgi:hypothetical protein